MPPVIVRVEEFAVNEPLVVSVKLPVTEIAKLPEKMTLPVDVWEKPPAIVGVV
jgi:hypothetical protein